MQPFISIIMPVYNNEKYFPNAVNSILSQSFHDWELIIVDDGSTDSTPQIADKFVQTDERIRVVHQENQWVYASVNNGTALASGEYVLMFNSDDLLNVQAIQKLHDIAVVDNADIVMFNLSENICDKEQNIISRDLHGRSRFLTTDFSYNDRSRIHREWFNYVKMGLTGHQCAYKAGLAKANKMRTDVYGGDYLYNLKLADQISSVAGTVYEVYMYLIYPRDDMNVSVGKYYGYEHEMYNDMYGGYRELLKRWGVYGIEERKYFSGARMTGLAREFRELKKQEWPIDKKLETIMRYASDDTVYELAADDNRIDELEGRTLAACREAFLKEIPKEESKYYFLYELLNSLLRYEKTQYDLKNIREGTCHELNPKHIGQYFLNKLEKRNYAGYVQR